MRSRIGFIVVLLFIIKGSHATLSVTNSCKINRETNGPIVVHSCESIKEFREKNAELKTSKYMELRFNKNLNLAVDAFRGFDSLESLTIKDNTMTNLNFAFLVNLKKLIKLDIVQKNAWVNKTHDWEKIKDQPLENVYLEVHYLTPEIVNSFPSKLKSLTIFESRIGDDGTLNVYRNHPKLLTLSITKCSLRKFELCGSETTSLQNLDLSFNALTDVAFLQSDHWKNLEALKLQYNQITMLDQNFFHMSALSSLNLERNNIATVDTRILSKCTKLHSLKLSSNSLHSIKVGNYTISMVPPSSHCDPPNGDELIPKTIAISAAVGFIIGIVFTIAGMCLLRVVSHKEERVKKPAVIENDSFKENQSEDYYTLPEEIYDDSPPIPIANFPVYARPNKGVID